MTHKTYAGIPEAFSHLETSEVVLIPVPYDGTSTWQKGADKGPDAFLQASENMELYDIETKSEPYLKGVYLAPRVTENASPEEMVQAVYQSVKGYIQKGKFTTVFGGEHSVSIGTIRAFAEAFKNLTVVQLDAHTDLRPEYQGSKCNHACALYEASKTTNLIQVGIRSMDIEEKEHLQPKKTYFAHDLLNDEWPKKALRQMTENVFITIDLDVFDPSIMPSTGTPEPGGLHWYPALKFLKSIFKAKRVVGFDIVELCPNPHEKSSDFLAAKLYYKMLAYHFKYQKN